MSKQYKALSLLSGGLDSQLAICVLREQGIDVESITYRSPFFGTAKGEAAAKALGVKHHIIDFTEDILEQVQNPAHGLGNAMNPCIDCHTHMIMHAGKLMEEWRFDFIATGEVLAQRPMSQNKQSLGVVARCSKYADLLVRPLSASLLPPTKPIREGWIDVDKLPAFSGRSRTPQMELARHFGITDYPTPAGGCLLTEKRFGQKLKDLLDHEGPDADRITCLDLPCPTVIAPPNASEEQLKTAAAICARYAKTPKDQPCEVQIINEAEVRTIEVLPMDPEAVKALMITP